MPRRTLGTLRNTELKHRVMSSAFLSNRSGSTNRQGNRLTDGDGSRVTLITLIAFLPLNALVTLIALIAFLTLIPPGNLEVKHAIMHSASGSNQCVSAWCPGGGVTHLNGGRITLVALVAPGDDEAEHPGVRGTGLSHLRFTARVTS